MPPKGGTPASRASGIAPKNGRATRRLRPPFLDEPAPGHYDRLIPPNGVLSRFIFPKSNTRHAFRRSVPATPGRKRPRFRRSLAGRPTRNPTVIAPARRRPHLPVARPRPTYHRFPGRTTAGRGSRKSGCSRAKAALARPSSRNLPNRNVPQIRPAPEHAGRPDDRSSRPQRPAAPADDLELAPLAEEGEAKRRRRSLPKPSPAPTDSDAASPRAGSPPRARQEIRRRKAEGQARILGRAKAEGQDKKNPAAAKIGGELESLEDTMKGPLDALIESEALAASPV